MVFPAPVAWDAITVGMDVTATTTWATTGATVANRGIVTARDSQVVTFDSGDTAPNPAHTPDGATVAFQQMAAAPAEQLPPALGTIITDGAGAAWQATGTTAATTMLSINGDRLSWAEFLTAHPTYTTMKDSPVTPLPAPVAPYPTVITPDAARLGMDIRVTVTYTAGGSKVVRGTCCWQYTDGDPTADPPDYIQLSISTGEVFYYNPVPDGQTLTVEQMQGWTVASDAWGISNINEPAQGAVVRSRAGVAWQRFADATAADFAALPLITNLAPAQTN